MEDHYRVKDQVLIQELEKTLMNLPTREAILFAKSLYPIVPSKSLSYNIFENLKKFYRNKFNRKDKLIDIQKEVLQQAKLSGPVIYQRMKELYLTDFAPALRRKSLLPDGFDGDAQIIRVIPAKEVNKGNKLQCNEDINNHKNGINDKLTGSDVPACKKLEQNQQISIFVTETNRIINLVGMDICLCGKEAVSINVSSQQLCFVCQHCQRNYHTECMKKKPSTRYCSYCHLSRIMPLRNTKKMIFMGHLKKGRKRHQILFNVLKEDLDKDRLNFELRSIRLQEDIQNTIKFPDAVTITLNGVFCKEFTPLHVNSTLKYRKDDPVLIKKLEQGENKMVFNQRLASEQSPNDRIETEGHLVALFSVYEKTTDTFIREIRSNQNISFENSKRVLQNCFVSSNDDEVSCQVVKIPLTCTLTRQRIHIPARGIFCKHFQCFDLKNFIQLTARCRHPRWVCPICREPGYKFKIDYILMAVLDQFPNPNADTAMFHSNDQFQVYIGQDLYPGSQDMPGTLNALAISQKKRLTAPETHQKIPKKRLRRNLQKQPILSLDSD